VSHGIDGRCCASARRRGLLSVLLVLAVLTMSACGLTSDAGSKKQEPASSTLRGSVIVPAQARSAAVAIATGSLVATSKVTANTPDPRRKGKAVLVRAVRVQSANQFTVVLNRISPAGGTKVDWVATDLKPATSQSDASGSDAVPWDATWTALIIVALTALLGALFAFVFIARKRDDESGPRPDYGLEFASYLKVSALVVIAALALVGVMITAEDENKNLSALFTLLGTIAGYLAAQKSLTEGADPAPEGGAAGDEDDDGDGDGGGDGNGDGAPAVIVTTGKGVGQLVPPASKSTRRPARRSLL
jgi:hypothetical protein